MTARLPRSARGRLACLVVSLFLFWVGSLTGVAAAAAEPFAYDLSAELMSPFCPGRTLAACPSPQAAELVQWMVVQEAGGASREQVIEMLIEDYGEEILGAPPAKGITLWAYVFPVLGFLAGGAIAFYVLRRVVSGGAAGPNAAAAASERAGSGLPGQAVVAADEDDLGRIVDAELALRD